MPKSRLLSAELVFIVVAASALFFFTVYQMSIDGIIPGNDPAVHLEVAKNIVTTKVVDYSEIFWYPPLFHTFLAALLLFTGTVDVVIASLILKFVVATISVLLFLATYVLCRRLLGTGIALASSLFAFLSVPLFKMTFWGGYPNYLSIAFIVLICYIINTNWASSIKTFLLFLISFSLVLTHQLSALVLFIAFVPAFFISTIISKRKFFAFFAILVGGALAVLAWYAEPILRNSSVFIYHVFFQAKENVLDISSVTFDSLVNNFGLTLILAVAGIPLTFILLKKRKALSVYPLLFLWLAIPFFLSQSFIFGLYLPYERFIYYLATPMAIFAGATVYGIIKLPTVIKSKLSSKTGKILKTLNIVKIITFVMLFGLFFSQSFLSLQNIQGFPQFYKTLGTASYDACKWFGQYSTSDNSSVVVSQKPGAWLHLISDHMTIEEKWSPVLGRNAVAETVLYLFYEMDNSRSLTREYVSGGSLSGQALCLSIYNVWEKVLSIFDSNVYVTFTDNTGKDIAVSLSETTKKTYWTQKSADNMQLVSEYSNTLFALEKAVSIRSESPLVDLNWKFTPHQNLTNAKLKISSYTEPSFDFTEEFIPGVLIWQNEKKIPIIPYWQNPWDKPSSINMTGNWALAEYPSNSLIDNFAAILDSENGVLLVFQFANIPEWLEVGAQGNRFIDSLRVGYQFGDLGKNESREVSFSILTYSSEPKQSEPPTEADLKQLLRSTVNLNIQERDFLTYIKEYSVEFVVFDSEPPFSDIQLFPTLDKIYDNGKFVIYSVRQ